MDYNIIRMITSVKMKLFSQTIYNKNTEKRQKSLGSIV